MTDQTQDTTKTMADMMAELAKHAKKANRSSLDEDIKYPIEVNAIKKVGRVIGDAMGGKAGDLVRIRPCADQYGGKTYLGFLLGSLPTGLHAMYDPEEKDLSIFTHNNAAIFVPDLKKIIWGMESWWAPIKSEAELKEITNNEIDNVWYVKALKAELAKEEPNGSA